MTSITRPVQSVGAATFDPSGSRPQVLYLAHRFPYPPDKGDRIRTYHLLRSLAQVADIHLACFADEPTSQADLAELRSICRRVEVIRMGNRARRLRALIALIGGRTATEGAFASHVMHGLIGRWVSETRFHAAIASSSGMVQYLDRCPAPAVVDFVDVDSQKWLDYAGAGWGPLAWIHRIEGRRLGNFERAVVARVRAVTFVSKAEADLFRRSGGEGPIREITNGVDFEMFRPSSPVDLSGNCVFVGALDYRPNADGVHWFCREVWPAILARHPGTRFTIVGRNPSRTVRRLARLPGVELIGQVPDVRPHLAAATVVVVPLRIARGVQNKVLEALAMGKAVVASPGAIEGIDVTPGVQLLAAARPTEWVEAVVQLLNDADMREQIGASGRSFVEQAHNWERCLQPFQSLLGLNSAGVGAPVQSPAVAEAAG